MENCTAQSKVKQHTLITRKREPARSFFLENLAPNILLLRPTCLCLGGKKLSYMFIQLLHVYKAVMVYFLRMLYFMFGDTFTSIKEILCQKTVHSGIRTRNFVYLARWHGQLMSV